MPSLASRGPESAPPPVLPLRPGARPAIGSDTGPAPRRGRRGLRPPAPKGEGRSPPRTGEEGAGGGRGGGGGGFDLGRQRTSSAPSPASPALLGARAGAEGPGRGRSRVACRGAGNGPGSAGGRGPGGLGPGRRGRSRDACRGARGRAAVAAAGGRGPQSWRLWGERAGALSEARGGLVPVAPSPLAGWASVTG